MKDKEGAYFFVMSEPRRTSLYDLVDVAALATALTSFEDFVLG
jgi:hypothetical protein